MDLELNAYANARAHFESRKKHMHKQQKTVDANVKALKAAEKRTQQQLSKVWALFGESVKLSMVQARADEARAVICHDQHGASSLQHACWISLLKCSLTMCR